jgi:hypothetical protein
LYLKVSTKEKGTLTNAAALLLSFINSRPAMASWIAYYSGFLFFIEIILMIESTNGTPTNIIQGTKEMVRKKVLRYNGITDNCSPKR